MTLEQIGHQAAGPGARLLTSREREVLSLLASGSSYADAAAELGLSERSVKSIFSVGRARLEGKRGAAAVKWGRDCYGRDSESPAEARARVVRELAAGVRCRHPMFWGGPCSLLLPCGDHGE